MSLLVLGTFSQIPMALYIYNYHELCRQEFQENINPIHSLISMERVRTIDLSKHFQFYREKPANELFIAHLYLFLSAV